MYDKCATRQYYDNVYQAYKSKMSRCPNSMDNLSKARRRVNMVFESFHLSPLPMGAQVLDVGSGLGYMSEALRLAGGIVTGIDVSAIAIEMAAKSFPQVDFQCRSFPDELEKNEEFDVIWCNDLSLMNTLDIDQMCRSVIEPSLGFLLPNGVLIVGWHTNFSGRVVSGYAHWSLQTIRDLRIYGGLSAPRVVEVRFSLMSTFVILTARFLKRSVPVFFVRRKEGAQS